MYPFVEGYIYTNQNGVDIINLEKTREQIQEAVSFLKSLREQNKKIVFIGEKPEVTQIIKEIALALGEPYVVNRFIGGSLTNFSQIKKRIEKLHTMLEDKEKGEWSKLTKKEQLLKQREMEKLDRNFGGLSSLVGLPGAIVVVDSKHEVIPVCEAAISHIPVVSLSNTDCDISTIEYPIICNDSSKSSVEAILKIIKDNI